MLFLNIARSPKEQCKNQTHPVKPHSNFEKTVF